MFVLANIQKKSTYQTHSVNLLHICLQTPDESRNIQKHFKMILRNTPLVVFVIIIRFIINRSCSILSKHTRKT